MIKLEKLEDVRGIFFQYIKVDIRVSILLIVLDNMQSIKHKTISLNNSLNNNIEILKLGNKKYSSLSKFKF